MAELPQLRNSVAVMRAELRNLRKQVEQLRRILKSETQSINGRIESVSQEKSPQVPLVTATPTPYPSSRASLVSRLSESAIGTIKTCFREKNGTPRQPGLVRSARGEIRIDSCKSFTNPSHSLEGLEEFSHAWLVQKIKHSFTLVSVDSIYLGIITAVFTASILIYIGCCLSFI